MTSLLDVPADVEVLGCQTPRVSLIPPAASSSAGECLELAEEFGLHLDPWQCHVLDGALGERPDGRWAARNVDLIVARQNGKGAILEARELAGLFLFGEKLMVHTAHQYRTADEAFLRLWGLISNHPVYGSRMKSNTSTSGKSITNSRTGQRLLFMTRSSAAGRGFSCDLMVYDEAYNLTDSTINASLPTMRARPNPQTWYTSSAPTPAPESDVLRRQRKLGREGKTPRLAYYEWSAPDDSDSDDRAAWAAANPGLGIRILPEAFEDERGAMTEEGFRQEILSISPDVEAQTVLDMGVWASLADTASEVLDPVVFALDATPDRSRGAIAVAGRRADGLRHVEVGRHAPGLDWMVAEVVRMSEQWKPAAVLLDPSSAVGSLLPELRDRGLIVTEVTAREVAQACGLFVDEVKAGKLRHRGQANLTAAVQGARKRDLANAWAWDRKRGADISPLVAVTLALWGHAGKVLDLTTAVW